MKYLEEDSFTTNCCSRLYHQVLAYCLSCPFFIRLQVPQWKGIQMSHLWWGELVRKEGLHAAQPLATCANLGYLLISLNCFIYEFLKLDKNDL